MVSWAKAVVIDGVTYYWMSFSKVCEELPAVFSKEDTVYRCCAPLKLRNATIKTANFQHSKIFLVLMVQNPKTKPFKLALKGF